MVHQSVVIVSESGCRLQTPLHFYLWELMWNCCLHCSATPLVWMLSNVHSCLLSLFQNLLFACAAHYFFADTVFLASFACATLSSFQFSVLTVIVIVVVAVMGLTFVVWHSSPLIVVCRASLVQNARQHISICFFAYAAPCTCGFSMRPRIIELFSFQRLSRRVRLLAVIRTHFLTRTHTFSCWTYA